MTLRVVIWCGAVVQRPTRVLGETLRARGRAASTIETDFFIQLNNVRLAFDAARAAGALEVTLLLPREHDLRPDTAPRPRLATVSNLFEVTRAYAASSKDQDELWFIACNHGTSNGLAATASGDQFDDATEPSLTPEELSTALDRVKGGQTLIVGTCHAGVFGPIAGGRRVVVTACQKGETITGGGPRGDECTPFLREFLTRWTGVGFKADAAPAKLDLRAAFEAVVEQARAEGWPEPKLFT